MTDEHGSRHRGHALAATLLVALVGTLFPHSRALAHDQSFSYVDLRWGRERVELRATLHRDDAAPALGVVVPGSLMAAPFLARESDRLFQLVTSRVRIRADQGDLLFRPVSAEVVPDQHAVRLTLEASCPRAVTRLHADAVLFPEIPQHETFLNVYDGGGRIMVQEVLTAKRGSLEVYAGGARGVLAVVGTFVRAGIQHIYLGLDHILFIIGLLLLGGGLGRVLRVATAFTLAHSITLALAVLGLVRLPGRVIEPLIALSVVYVGFENLSKGVRAADWRARIAFAFGLIHGFGFASVLREFGLPHHALAWSLLGFNLGVEIGQASIVILVVPLLGALRAVLPRVAARATVAGSWGIIGTGTFWFVTRVLTRG